MYFGTPGRGLVWFAPLLFAYWAVVVYVNFHMVTKQVICSMNLLLFKWPISKKAKMLEEARGYGLGGTPQ